jgi:hypothetical protein
MGHNSLSVIQQTETFLGVAKTFAESGLFADSASAAKCFVKIMAGAEMGLPPFTSMNAFHIIKGKVTLAAGTIAARIKGSARYNYRVIEKSSTRCSIEFTENGVVAHVETWDADRAKRAGVQNMDKFPDAMLFSRAISAGARVACPDIIGAYYTPEEMGAAVDADGEVVPEVKIGGQLVEQEPPQPAVAPKLAPAPAAPADNTWKAELIALGKQAAAIVDEHDSYELQPGMAEWMDELKEAMQCARTVLIANGRSTQSERTAAINALKEALNPEPQA